MKYVILHDIRSHYNVGAIFRTADASGVAKVYLSGYTPAPLDRFGRAVPEIHKTALGAEASVPWEKITDTEALLLELKASGVMVVVVEQSDSSTNLYDFHPPQNVAYLFGSETEGVPPPLLAASQVILELPMLGEKESLNVSVTAGIVLYHK
jgi:23S rRNA (guanosine2251-2'-O)-methyltransferase